MKKTFQLIINYELLDEFYKLNNMLEITDEMLEKNNMFKNIVYATENNFVGRSVYPKDMPLVMNKNVWEKLIKINNELKEKIFVLKFMMHIDQLEYKSYFGNFFMRKKDIMMKI